MPNGGHGFGQASGLAPSISGGHGVGCGGHPVHGEQTAIGPGQQVEVAPGPTSKQGVAVGGQSAVAAQGVGVGGGVMKHGIVPFGGHGAGQSR